MNTGFGSSRRTSLFGVMQIILRHGPISRASIAKQTGLSKQTVSEIALKLEDGGWIRKHGRTSGHVGRTATTYDVVREAACISTADLGGTYAKAAIADLAGNIINEVTEPTDRRGGVHVAEQIARLCNEAAARRAIEFKRVRLAVVGVAGVPDSASGRVKLAPNIQGLDAIDFRAALSDRLGLPVHLENDVNLAILGEHWNGRGSEDDDLVFIALGTGIGAGIMVGGNLVRGAEGAAGEIAYLPIGADPFEPESVRVGALERAAGSLGIIDRFRALSGKTLSVPDVFAAAADGSLHANAVLDETAQHIACAVTAVCAIMNPAKVILGGSIGLRPEFGERVRKLLPKCDPIQVRIETSALGRRAALVGASAVGFRMLHEMLFSDGVRELRGRISRMNDTMHSTAAP